ncbi:MAG: hypothetical protein KIT09_32985 [Bryobacteraceae bacterium]|nr:hypothetical protein [Bryobacteraceae bacterium]
MFLKVHVNDPAGLLPVAKPSPISEPHLIIGVRFGNGAYLGAHEVNSDTTGRDYQMAIPIGEPLNLWVFSRYVTLTDGKGSALDNSGAMIPFEALSGQDQFFALNVSGPALGSE